MGESWGARLRLSLTGLEESWGGKGLPVPVIPGSGNCRSPLTAELKGLLAFSLESSELCWVTENAELRQQSAFYIISPTNESPSPAQEVSDYLENMI